jgi:hypothetical protein
MARAASSTAEKIDTILTVSSGDIVECCDSSAVPVGQKCCTPGGLLCYMSGNGGSAYMEYSSMQNGAVR